DVWAFVHYAQVQNLGLDFTTPARRLVRTGGQSRSEGSGMDMAARRPSDPLSQPSPVKPAAGNAAGKARMYIGGTAKPSAPDQAASGSPKSTPARESLLPIGSPSPNQKPKEGSGKMDPPGKQPATPTSPPAQGSTKVVPTAKGTRAFEDNQATVYTLAISPTG